MTYWQQVNRVLTKHRAKMETGEAQAKRQERFVEWVESVLYKNHVRHDRFVNDDFDVIFYLSGFSGSLKSLFPHFWVEEDGAEWVMCNPNIPEIQVIIRLEAMP